MNNEFIAGAFSGLAQNIVGHPFDTAKVMVQNNKRLHSIKPLQFYRGFMYPTVFSVISNSCVFPVNKYVNDRLHNTYASGFITGVTISPLCYVFDLLKVKRQIPGKMSLKMYGLGATAGRESIGFCFWLGSYFQLTKEYKISSFWAGGIAGILAWTFSYPVDVIKNRQMAQDISFKQAYRVGNLWKGYGLCITRAAVVNSIGFYVYDKTMKKLL